MPHAPAAEVGLVVAVEAVVEREGVVEHEAAVVEQVHHQRCGGDRVESGRLGPRGVEVLVVGVQGDGEQAAPLPLEVVPGVLAQPHLGGPPAAEHVHELLEHVPQGAELAAGRDLAHPGVVGAAGAVQVHEGGTATQPLPGRELDGVQVVDGHAPHHRDPLLSDPFLVRALLVARQHEAPARRIVQHGRLLCLD
jgi:hypothetical protein